jgi:hypothetical protein
MQSFGVFVPRVALSPQRGTEGHRKLFAVRPEATLSRCKLQRVPSYSYRATKIDIDKRDSEAGLEVSCRIRSAGDGIHGAVGFRVMSVHHPSRLENRTGSIQLPFRIRCIRQGMAQYSALRP